MRLALERVGAVLLVAAWALGPAPADAGESSRALTISDVRAWAGELHPLAGQAPQAVAVSVREDGRGVAGFASGYEHPAAALTEALARCEEERDDAAGTDVCRPFSLGKKVVFEFAPTEPADTRAAPPDPCLGRPEVEFYRLEMWIRVFHSADLSFQEGYRTEFEVRLAMDGSLREAKIVEAESGAFDEKARRALEDAGPFGPLFGDLSCLYDAPFRFRFADPRKPEGTAL